MPCEGSAPLLAFFSRANLQQDVHGFPCRRKTRKSSQRPRQPVAPVAHLENANGVNCLARIMKTLYCDIQVRPGGSK
jgi:hypothetical protein